MKHPPVTFLGKQFTMKDLESWASRVLSSRSGLDDEQDQRLACEIVRNYDKVYSVGEEVSSVLVGQHPDWGGGDNLCFHVAFESGHTLTVARKKVVRSCFDPEKTKERRRLEKLYANMRNVVHRFVGEFKKDQCVDGHWKCELCSECSSDREKVHADHVWEFRFMVEKFKELYSDYAWDTEVRPPAEWEGWHNENAKLRMLCKSCNLRRKRPKA